MAGQRVRDRAAHSRPTTHVGAPEEAGPMPRPLARGSISTENSIFVLKNTFQFF